MEFPKSGKLIKPEMFDIGKQYGQNGLPTVSPGMEEAFTSFSEHDFFSLIGDISSKKGFYSLNVVQSDKDKGEHYLFHEKTKQLTSKPRCFVALRASQGTPDPQMNIRLSMRYCDVQAIDDPVVCDQKCDEVNNSVFCVKHSNELYYPVVSAPFDNHRHPEICFTLNTAGELNVDFYVMFMCLNSCPSHKRNGGKRRLILEILNDSMQAVVKEELIVRVCKGVKRDHKAAIGETTVTPKRLKPSSVLAGPPSVLAGPANIVKREMPLQDTETCTITLHATSGDVIEPQQQVNNMADGGYHAAYIKMPSDDTLNTVKTVIESMGGKFQKINI